MTPKKKIDPFEPDRVSEEAIQKMFGKKLGTFYGYYILRDGVGPKLMGHLWDSLYAPGKTLARLSEQQARKLLARK